MSPAIHALLAFNLLALLFVIWRLQVLRRQNAALSQALTQLSPAAAATPPDLAAMLGAGRSDLIAIEILNPMELARKESWLAGVFGTLTPALVRRIVSDQAIKNVKIELQKWGVEAEVSLHRVRR